MHTTHLRKVGGSVMLALPPAVLEMLNLSAGSAVGVTVDQGNILITPPPRYSLEELLAQGDFDAAPSAEDRAWLDDAPVGRELL